MDDARASVHGFYKFVGSYFYAEGAKADGFCGFGDAEHAHTYFIDAALLPEKIEIKVFAIPLAYHLEAGGATVFYTELLYVWEFFRS